ncbi:MAG: class II aldolase/adducin family protein [Rhodospirillales bacterium]
MDAAQSLPRIEPGQGVRRDLAAAYQLISHFGMDDSIFTHISARVPGPEHHFLLNAYGLRFEEVTPSNLVTVDLDGKIVDDPTGRGINPAGFTIHSAVHAVREDAACVLHTHTPAGIAVACTEGGLQSINQWSLQFHGRVAYHGYEAIALDLAERERIQADLGAHQVLILRNHGLLTCGRSAGEAFKLMYNLERSCRVQMTLQASGQPIVPVPVEIAEKTAGQYAAAYDAIADGTRRDQEWEAYLRLLDRVRPGWADA